MLRYGPAAGVPFDLHFACPIVFASAAKEAEPSSQKFGKRSESCMHATLGSCRPATRSQRFLHRKKMGLKIGLQLARCCENSSPTTRQVRQLPDEGVWAGEALGVGPAAHRTWEAVVSTAACRVDGQKAVTPTLRPEGGGEASSARRDGTRLESARVPREVQQRSATGISGGTNHTGLSAFVARRHRFCTRVGGVRA